MINRERARARARTRFKKLSNFYKKIYFSGTGTGSFTITIADQIGMPFAYLYQQREKESQEAGMNKAQLEQKIAKLEFIHDQLETELSYVDGLLKSVGFPRGLASAKEVALELLEDSKPQSENE